MPGFPRLPALRNRARAASTIRPMSTGASFAAPAKPSRKAAFPSLPRRDSWPSPATAVLAGPKLLLRGPGLLLRAPGAVWRAPGRTRRLFSHAARLRRQQQPLKDSDQVDPNLKQQQQQQQEEEAKEEAGFGEKLKSRWKETPTSWYPIPLSLGAAVLVVVSFYKQVSLNHDSQDSVTNTDNKVKVAGPWQVHVAAALPLRALSRAWGHFNSTELPEWAREPGYKLYSFIFGVTLEEAERPLREYKSMSEFFMRRLKPGSRVIEDAPLVSPADGKLVNLGYVTPQGRIAHIKGGEYSLSALLNGTGPVGDDKRPQPPHVHRTHPHDVPLDELDEAEFANVNGISYSLSDMISGNGTGAGASRQEGETKDATHAPPELSRSISHDAQVAMDAGMIGTDGGQDFKLGPGKKLCFAVVYLAPGDYHRYHSPANWVVEKRRHFAGELFSVSPWFVGKLADLFVLNERVALLGRWKHGFFSMVPVGATNVGSIRVNFDSSLRTNSPLKPITPGTYSEATYSQASPLLGGQPLRAGDEVGGFWLGSTIVLVFEAPEKWKWDVSPGEVVKVGQKLGEVAP